MSDSVRQVEIFSRWLCADKTKGGVAFKINVNLKNEFEIEKLLNNSNSPKLDFIHNSAI